MPSSQRRRSKGSASGCILLHRLNLCLGRLLLRLRLRLLLRLRLRLLLRLRLPGSSGWRLFWCRQLLPVALLVQADQLVEDGQVVRSIWSAGQAGQGCWGQQAARGPGEGQVAHRHRG